MKLISKSASCGINGIEHQGCKYSELDTSLDALIMPNRVETFIGLASGDSMKNLGLFDGDLLVIDRAVEVKDGDVIVANLNGEFVCKILDYENRRLISASDDYPPVFINECDEFSFEGVVTSSIRLFRSREGFKSKLF